MKKFLLILLFAIVFCATEEAREEMLAAQNEEIIPEEKIDTVEAFLYKADGLLRGIHEQLKRIKEWENVINLLKKGNIDEALKKCKTYTYERKGCNQLIYEVDKRIEK